ncbi:MAG: cation diffusion facilitator family transporter [Thermoprotei archaeon]|jgi:cation diffusion facilitator family transporter
MHNSKRVIYVALISNIAVFLAKLGASIITGSIAMLAETLRSLSDIMNQTFLAIGVNLSSQGSSQKYPFGRGKEVFFWSFIASLFVIGGSGILSVAEGMNRLFSPKNIFNGNVIFIVLSLAFIFETISLINLLKTHKQKKLNKYYDGDIRITRNPALFIVLVEDVSAIIEIIVVFISIYASIYLGLLYLDGLAAIFVGLIMIIIGLHIAKQSKEQLIGIGLEPYEIENIRKIILSIPHVNQIIDIKSVYFGVNRVILGIDINFKDKLTTDEIEHTIDEIEQKIKQLYPFIKHIYIEAEGQPVIIKKST